jgi:hypothetical protein
VEHRAYPMRRNVIAHLHCWVLPTAKVALGRPAFQVARGTHSKGPGTGTIANLSARDRLPTASIRAPGRWIRSRWSSAISRPPGQTRGGPEKGCILMSPPGPHWRRRSPTTASGGGQAEDHQAKHALYQHFADSRLASVPSTRRSSRGSPVSEFVVSSDECSRGRGALDVGAGAGQHDRRRSPQHLTQHPGVAPPGRSSSSSASPSHPMATAGSSPF